MCHMNCVTSEATPITRMSMSWDECDMRRHYCVYVPYDKCDIGSHPYNPCVYVMG